MSAMAWHEAVKHLLNLQLKLILYWIAEPFSKSYYIVYLTVYRMQILALFGLLIAQIRDYWIWTQKQRKLPILDASQPD
jgi:hypothetical protein